MRRTDRIDDGGRTTLAMVAAQAGVSTATASKVLNGRTDVAAQTRDRVVKTMERLGYVPVGRPRRPDTSALAAAFDSFGTMYSTAVLAGIMEAAFDLDIEVSIGFSPRELAGPDPESWVRQQIAAGRHGAILVTAEVERSLIEAARRYDLSLVAIDPKARMDEGMISIGATNWAGASEATRHLLELGHRRIAFAGADGAVEYAAERLAGYRSTLERAGVPFDPGLVMPGSTEFSSGQQIGAALLTRQDPPSAVVAICDAVALGVIEAARNLGVRIPEDLSVVGFDDVQAASWSTPLLTTIRQPLADMGALAVRTVMRVAGGGRPDSHHVQLATTLIVRGSTAPPQG